MSDSIILFALVLAICLTGLYLLRRNSGHNFFSVMKQVGKSPQPQNQGSNYGSSSVPFAFLDPSLNPPSNAPNTFQSGVGHLKNQNYEAAIEDLTKWISYDSHFTVPFSDLAYLYRAIAYQNLGHHQQALKNFNLAAQNNPTSVQIFMQRADFKQRYLSDYAGALEDVAIAMKLDPDNRHNYCVRGLVRAKLKEADWFSDFEKAFSVSRHFDPAPIYVQRAQAYYAIGDLTAALKDFREAIRLNTEQVAYCLRMMAHIFHDKKDYKQALAVLDRVITHEPSNPFNYEQRGYTRQYVTDWTGSLEDYTKALTLTPKNHSVYNNRAWVKLILAQYDDALLDCNRAISLDDKYEYSFGTRGTVNFLLEKHDDALNDFNKAIEIKSDHKFAIMGQAITHRKMGNIDEARKRWQALIEFDPDYVSEENLRDKVLFPESILKAVETLKAEFNSPNP